jgi:hypothetical protein
VRTRYVLVGIATVEGEDTVYDNVIVYGEIRDSKVIRGCLREA